VLPSIGSAPGRAPLARDVEAGQAVSTSRSEEMSSAVEAAVRYVILIYRNPVSRQMWESLSDSDRASGLQVYRKLNEDLVASGEYIASEALTYPENGRQVWRREDGTISSDGPYAEAKEHLAGFFLLDCASLDRAVEIAGRVPEADLGLVEVRPVLDLAALGG